jgi:diketogulonate reductase-like aldo/keto reductase
MNLSSDSTVELRTGNKMPILALGTWRLTNDTADTVAYALELGYKHIDTSSDYQTQPGIGEGIRQSQVDRANIYITSKVEETDDAYARTLSNLEELQLDYLDLELIHRPPPGGAGEKLWADLIRAKAEGLVRDIGVSNYTTGQIDTLIEDSGEVPVVNQIEWSPFGHSEAMKQYCADKNILIQAYSPLTRAKRLDNPELGKLAEKYGRSPAQILIRWNLQLGTVPLLKANQKKHLEENLDVFDFALTAEDLEQLNHLNEHYSTFGSLEYL